MSSPVLDRADQLMRRRRARRADSDDVPVLYLTELQFPTFYNSAFHDVVVNSDGTLGDFDGAWKAT